MHMITMEISLFKVDDLCKPEYERNGFNVEARFNEERMIRIEAQLRKKI